MYIINKSLSATPERIWLAKLNVLIGRDRELNLLIDFLQGGAGGIPNALMPHLRSRQDEHNKEFNALIKEAKNYRFDTVEVEKLRVQSAL